MFTELSIAAFFLALRETGPWKVLSNGRRLRWKGRCPLGALRPPNQLPLRRVPEYDEAIRWLGLSETFVLSIGNHADRWITSLADDTKRALSLATGVALP